MTRCQKNRDPSWSLLEPNYTKFRDVHDYRNLRPTMISEKIETRTTFQPHTQVDDSLKNAARDRKRQLNYLICEHQFVSGRRAGCKRHARSSERDTRAYGTRRSPPACTRAEPASSGHAAQNHGAATTLSHRPACSRGTFHMYDLIFLFDWRQLYCGRAAGQPSTRGTDHDLRRSDRQPAVMRRSAGSV